MHQASFLGVWIKVERAKEHIRNLEALVQRFLQSNPYEVVPYDDPDTGNLVFKLKASAQPSPYLGTVAGDAIHSLRASLDVLIWQLVLLGGHEPKRSESFPISDSADEFEAKGLRKVKRVPDQAVEFIKAAKPYKGGNDALWKLHNLDIRDKHRLLIPVGMAYRNVILDFARAFDDSPDLPPELAIPQDFSMPIAIRPADRQYPLKDGAVLFVVSAEARRGSGTQMHNNPQFTFEVAFGEGEIVQGEPLVPTLHQLAQFIEGFVEPFKGLFVPGLCL
jgi:hypothetical protein